MALSKRRVAWLLPSLERGFYWHPVLKEFSRLFPKTIIFTGIWPGFAPGYENSFRVKVLRKTRIIETSRLTAGTSRALIIASLGIVHHLLSFKPHVIFTSAFSIWTALALVLKPCQKWRVIISYDGCSPNVDCRDSRVRLFFRRMMARLADGFITNNRSGKLYLTELLRAKESRVFVTPYQIPTPEMLLNDFSEPILAPTELRQPMFLFVGAVRPAKGVHLLLKAFVLLQKQRPRRGSLLLVGDGPQRIDLKNFITTYGLEDQVKWAGWVSYSRIGKYFEMADVFIFPTLEDVWGMVVLEAMAFGKPILCSKWAGAAELVVDDQNGYVFDPNQPERLAELMRRFIDNVELIPRMGEKSRQLIAAHTPEAAAKHLARVATLALDNLHSVNGRP
jgi:glycosyltransferase involved in cell wall biosynthesis